jgi:hypothetical protein
MKAAALAALMAVAIAAHARAQTDARAGDSAAASDRAQVQTLQLDPAKLGVSVSRIQRGLRLSETRERVVTSPLKLEYQVQVFGTAPRLDLLKGFNVSPGAPLSYGAPTHTDFLNHWTPQAFRSPPANVGALAGWALFQLAKRADKSKCEQEIADYRALVMQGVSAPAPRCTQ